MMFARNLKPGQTVKVTPADGGEVVHISQVCMSKPNDTNRTYLKVVQGGQSFAVCVLQKDKQESCSVDIFLSAREGIQLTAEGGRNELSVIGYFEPEPESETDPDEEEEGERAMAGFAADSDSEDEEDDDEEESETEGMKAPVDGRIEDLDAQEDGAKKAKGASKKALKALQAAAANDDNEDDDDDGEDGEEEEQSGSGSDDGSGGAASDEEEEEEEEATKSKRKAQQPVVQGSKKAKTQETPSGKGGDEAIYKNALVSFLKKNGRTPLASLGQKVKKPPSLPKMAVFLKSKPDVFQVEGGFCSLK